MTWHVAGLHRLDGIIWALVAAVAGLDLMAAAFGGFSVALGSYAAPAGTCLLLALAARYYGGRRNDPNLSSALESTAQVIAFAASPRWRRRCPILPLPPPCRCRMRPSTAWTARLASTGKRCSPSWNDGRNSTSAYASFTCH